MAAPKKIRIYGSENEIKKASDSTEAYFAVENSYSINTTRAKTEAVNVDLSNDQFIEVVFTDGTSWIGDRDTLFTLFPEMKEAAGRGPDGTPELPFALHSDEQSRGIAGQVGVKVFNILARKKTVETIHSLAEKMENTALEKREEGLYNIQPDFSLTPFTNTKASNTRKHYLLFIHGTASSTRGGFMELSDAALWKEMQGVYGPNILGFEQRTLTKSPFDNLLLLLQQLPLNAEIDVITHSRGGLVGELLLRFLESPEGFSKESIELLNNDANYSGLNELITEITKTIKNRKLKTEEGIRVNKFIRVAATGAGTSLLSASTDVYLNTLANLITKFGPPAYQVIAGFIKGMIAEVVKTKNNFTQLPGVEAQRPESVLIKLINSYKGYDEHDNPVSFDNRLIVISGNGKMSVSVDGLKIALTKFLFKWGDNDLVVDTESMYQGAKRKYPVQYFLDSTKETNHFRYFKNTATRDALRNALFATSVKVPGFSEIPPESLDVIANRGIFGLDSGKLAPVNKISGSKPILVLLPGIMGSFLEKDAQPLWINYWQFARGGLFKLKPAEDDGILASGLIKTAYATIADYFSSEYDVLVFPYDWRNTLEKAGATFNILITDLLKKYNQTVHLIGHSMGGLVIRDLMVNYPDTWTALNKQKNFRTVLLGTPWLGSYRIPHVLSGKDSMIKQLSLIDVYHTKAELINLFNSFPGILDLLPIDDDAKDFASQTNWGVFVKASGLNIASIAPNLLQAFKKYRDKITEKLNTVDYSNIVYVAGQSKETVCDYKIEDGQLQFYATADGDQSVTWATGIPANLNSQSVYYTQVSHGSLANSKPLFKGIYEILKEGTTSSSAFRRQPFSQAKRAFISKEQAQFKTTDQQLQKTILSFEDPIEREQLNSSIVNVEVSKGDLMFAKHPVMIGHLMFDGIYSAERVADNYLKGALHTKHSLGLYPGPIGTNEIFIEKESPFTGAIVLGLGQSEELTPSLLADTIEKAVSNYLVKRCKVTLKENPDEKFGLSTLLIGAGYAGFSIETVCRSILQGVFNANAKVSAITEMANLYISTIEFVELFEDRALSCYNSLANLIKGNSDGLNIGWYSPVINALPGVRRRLLTDENVSWWQRLSVSSQQARHGVGKSLIYNSSTNNAREESQEMKNNLWLLESMFEEISNSDNWNYDTAKTLFEILIPVNFKEKIRRNAPIMWILDEETASYPWELLHTGGANEKPLCVGSGMIRQLSTENYKPTNSSGLKGTHMLIIGDPNLNGLETYRQLPGAEAEAKAIYEKFKKFNTTKLLVEEPLVKASTGDILKGLYRRNYKIIHVAAHGNSDPNNPELTGIVIGKQAKTGEPVYLTTGYLSQLPCIPELVYVNSCLTGKVDFKAEAEAAQNLKLAAGIGTELIKMGVKAVIVAAWEINDNAAFAFANEFYDRMLADYDFGDAVMYARRKVYRDFPETNTWGAFQCYGQPQYKLEIGKSLKEEEDEEYDYAQQAENDLENLISKSEVAFYAEEALMDELRWIEKKIINSKLETPAITQLLAKAFMELGDYEKAISYFKALFQNENAIFNVQSLENFEDIFIKNELKKFLVLEESIDDKVRREIAGTIDKEAGNIQKLIEICETGERFSLLGGAYKRKARVLKQEKDKLEAMQKAAQFYYSCYKKLGDSYSFQNWIGLYALANGLKFGGEQSYSTGSKILKEPISKAEAGKQLKLLEENLKRQNLKKNFWNLSQKGDVLLAQLFLAKTADYEKLAAEYVEDVRKLWAKTGSKQKKNRQVQHIELWEHFANESGAEKLGRTFKSIREKFEEK